MIDNLNGDGISRQIDLVGATVNPVRLVWAGGRASLAGVCLTAGGPAYTLKVAPFPTVITREPLGPQKPWGPWLPPQLLHPDGWNCRLEFQVDICWCRNGCLVEAGWNP